MKTKLIHGGTLLARLLLGGIFLYLGLVKAIDPVGFLKLVRQFGVVDTPPALNLIAAVLPWFEVFCGALLLTGIKVRAAAALQFVMLAGFTGLVLVRAIAIHQAGGTAFCAIRFDCGCGTGEVLVCSKLLQNAGLMLLAAFVVLASGGGPKPASTGL